MIRWYRVFGVNDLPPQPAELLEECRPRGVRPGGRSGGDALGCFQAHLVSAPASPPVRVDRYLPKVDAIRGELGSWAAWLETVEDNPHGVALMERVIRT